jgi:predicted XRE-type DNA-binding protein
MLKKNKLQQESSSGNVFADIGIPNAGEHMVKASLVVRIDRIIQERGLTQAVAAQLPEIDQPKVSALLSGQFRGYSVKRLMNFLVALGLDVEIVVRPKKSPTAELRVA